MNSTVHQPSNELLPKTKVNSTILLGQRNNNKIISTTTQQSFVVKKPKAKFSDYTITTAGVTIIGFSVAYWAWNRDVVLVTDRHRTLAISLELEERLGKALTGLLLEDFGNKVLPDDEPITLAIRKLAFRLIDTFILLQQKEFTNENSNTGRQRRPIINFKDWKVLVVDSDEVNAFCSPGGCLVVYTGLIRFYLLAKENNQIESVVDCLATVLSHELSHAFARHTMEKLSWLPIQLPFFFLSLDSDVLLQPFQYVFALPHSRLMENEADYIGTYVLALSGINPKDSINALRLLDNGGQNVLEWTSTHPTGNHRAEQIEHRLKQLMEIYQDAISVKSAFSRRVAGHHPALKTQFRCQLDVKTNQAEGGGGEVRKIHFDLIV